MTIVMFGGKRGSLASQRTPPQPFAAVRTGALHKIHGIMRKGKLCGYIEATTQDIS
jgi:hypothetical protein